MSATVLPFTGKQVGPLFERSPARLREDSRALRDARLIRDARRDEESWLQVAFLALLRALDAEQQLALQGFLAMRAEHGDDVAAEQALALVRFFTGTPEHCGRIASILERMNGGRR